MEIWESTLASSTSEKHSLLSYHLSSINSLTSPRVDPLLALNSNRVDVASNGFQHYNWLYPSRLNEISSNTNNLEFSHFLRHFLSNRPHLISGMITPSFRLPLQVFLLHVLQTPSSMSAIRKRSLLFLQLLQLLTATHRELVPPSHDPFWRVQTFHKTSVPVIFFG